MYDLARAIAGVLLDLLKFGALFFRSSESIRAENLVLCKQLAGYIERGIKPRRIDHANRASLALLTRLFDGRSAVVSVCPATIVRWHRVGWRIFWRTKCRAGRPPIPAELQELIRRVATENPLWGQERIANELLVKLGIRGSPRTVAKLEGARRLDESAWLESIARSFGESSGEFNLRTRDRHHTPRMSGLWCARLHGTDQFSHAANSPPTVPQSRALSHGLSTNTAYPVHPIGAEFANSISDSELA